jgi:hypothetical protein
MHFLLGLLLQRCKLRYRERYSVLKAAIQAFLELVTRL